MSQNLNDVLDRLKEHRQQMDAWRQQQVAFQERLKLFQQQQQDLREHLEIVREDIQYLEMLKQMKLHKRLERRSPGSKLFVIW